MITRWLVKMNFVSVFINLLLFKSFSFLCMINLDVYPFVRKPLFLRWILPIDDVDMRLLIDLSNLFKLNSVGVDILRYMFVSMRNKCWSLVLKVIDLLIRLLFLQDVVRSMSSLKMWSIEMWTIVPNLKLIIQLLIEWSGSIELHCFWKLRDVSIIKLIPMISSSG